MSNEKKMRVALEQISQWDMLNPVQSDRISDLHWLKDLVTSALEPEGPSTELTPALVTFLKELAISYAGKPNASGEHYMKLVSAAQEAVKP